MIRTIQQMRGLLPALLLAAVLVSAASAQQVEIQLLAVGDGTQFDTWALAAHNLSGASNNCTISGKNTDGKPFAAMHDTRLGTIPLEQGELWVVWGTIAAGKPTQVWAYLRMDSDIAARGYFAAPQAQLLLTGPLPKCQNLVAVLPPDAALLPSVIGTGINNATFNAAMTGVTPGQARTVTNKILSGPASPPTKYGYNPGPVGLTITSTVGSVKRTPVVFNVTGSDPITGDPIPAAALTNLPPSLVAPVVNATNVACPGGIGCFISTDHNVTEPCGTLSAGLQGGENTTGLLGAAPPGNKLTVFLDDPLASTWFEMENTIYAGCAGTRSQEKGVSPPANDPLNLSDPAVPSLRKRAIGQPTVISAVGTTKDSLGYVYWTCNAMAGKKTYLTVNNINPFVGPWTGTFPSCGTAADTSFPLQRPQFVNTASPVPTAINNLIVQVNGIVGPGLQWQ